MIAPRAETYPAETQVIGLAEVGQISWELSEDSEQDALPS